MPIDASEATDRRVFISYVREDASRVDSLERHLEAAGIRTWRDTARLWPGMDWRLEIREAITRGSFAFLACFSDHSVARQVSYQNEELLLAVEQMRQRSPGTPWLIPVRLADCEIPPFDLGAGRSLQSIQRVDLFGPDEAYNMSQLVAAVLGIVGVPREQLPLAPNLSITASVKRIIREPAAAIELEELITGLAKEARELLGDPVQFPRTFSDANLVLPLARFVLGQARSYQQAVRPFLEALVAGIAWGTPEHDELLRRSVGLVVNAPRERSGLTVLVELSALPDLLVLYATGLAAVDRRRYSALRAIAVDLEVRRLDGAASLSALLRPWSPFPSGADWLASLVSKATAADMTDEGEIDELAEMLHAGRIGKLYTPGSDYLFAALRPLFSESIVDDSEYTVLFDDLEALLGALAIDARNQTDPNRGPWIAHPTVGSTIWRHRHRTPTPEGKALAELQRLGSSWPPLQGGLFDGEPDRALSALEELSVMLVDQRHRTF